MLYICQGIYSFGNFNISGHCGHAGIHEQPSKCSSSKGNAHISSDPGSWRLYPITINLCGKKKYSRSLLEFHIRSSIPPGGDNGAIL